MSDNMTMQVGNLTRDLELRYTSGGTALATGSVAVNKRWQNRQTQEWEEETSFFNLVLWRELAENASESLHKGDRVVIVGQLRQRSWETDDGEKRSTVEITVDDIAPSLRWATVSGLARTKGKGNGTGVDQPPPPEDPWT
jgi:single-strand DNA-binding protein